MMKPHLVITLGTMKMLMILVRGTLTKLDERSPTRLGFTTCTVMFGNGVPILNHLAMFFGVVIGSIVQTACV